MNWQQLNPWNWFKHEEETKSDTQIPIKRSANEAVVPAQNANFSHPIARLYADINRVFDEVFGRAGFPSLTTGSLLSDVNGFKPSLNIASNEENYMSVLTVAVRNLF